MRIGEIGKNIPPPRQVWGGDVSLLFDPQQVMGIVFSGDIFVNIKGFTKSQARFNALAPYLMTSVDTDPAAAAKQREDMFALLDSGDWTVLCGHGAPYLYHKP